MASGIEQREIFADQEDYGDFLRRLGVGLDETESQCFAFSFPTKSDKKINLLMGTDSWSPLVTLQTTEHNNVPRLTLRL